MQSSFFASIFIIPFKVAKHCCPSMPPRPHSAGIREYAKANGASVVPLTEQEVEAWLAGSATQVRESPQF